ncbi:MAG TPA: acyl-CoA dehydrogenase [Myxococcaceae bacterium]|nr:acyl-CoA dehydrogenase [Myxococcaceae bacterium]
MADVNHYKTDLRDMQFALFEQFHFGELVGRAPFEGWGVDEARAILAETYRFAREVLGPLNATGDREGCRIVDGQVRTPNGFRNAWNQLYESGFQSLSVEPENGGQGAPTMLWVLVEEMLSGSNCAFNMYPGLTYGAAELISACGLPDQVKRYAEKMFAGKWGGTMCLTEPHAGSDVGAARTSARKSADGTYRIRGTKIFISAGDHDLAENIIHLVLARIEGAPPGTKGLSLFIVPKFRVNADASLGERNDVSVGSIEHKLGINGSATCVLNFGENDGCVGELVGGVEHAGMSQMFRMMNGARIMVGVQGLSVASSAFLNALHYARERKQGASFKHWKDPTTPRVPIIEHGDVRRMLMDMKAHVEGIRALIVKLAWHGDKARQVAGSDDDQAAYHKGQVELLTPLVKAFSSDQSFRICELAIQTFGGAGYLKDWPIEQYLRDSKIFSIYEGTNHIQAMDLVGRKMGQAGGAHFQAFMGDVTQFVEAHREDPELGADVQRLSAAQEAVMSSAMNLLTWSQTGKTILIPLAANRFLQMMAQLAVGWLLLDAAVIAGKAQAGLLPTDPERNFYEGKRASARWFARNVLPAVEHHAQVLGLEDLSAMEIPDAAFATE